MKRKVIIIFCLISCLFVVTLAFSRRMVNKDDNVIKTGNIKINLNDGKEIINENEFIFEPGMRVKKKFFVENVGTIDAYYKVYFKDISGELKNVLYVTLKDNDEVIYNGLVKDFIKDNVKVINDELKANERKELNIIFYYPKESNNDSQNKDLSFTLAVNAVQSKNNVNRYID